MHLLRRVIFMLSSVAWKYFTIAFSVCKLIFCYFLLYFNLIAQNQVSAPEAIFSLLRFSPEITLLISFGIPM